MLSFRESILGKLPVGGRVAAPDMRMLLREIRLDFLGLFSSQAYEFMRAPDRYALQGLRTRIAGWLEGPCTDVAAGQAILADVRAFAELLLHVNRREVLVTYDRNILRQAKEDLAALIASKDRLGVSGTTTLTLVEVVRRLN